MVEDLNSKHDYLSVDWKLQQKRIKMGLLFLALSNSSLREATLLDSQTSMEMLIPASLCQITGK